MDSIIISILSSGTFFGIVTYFLTLKKNKQEVRKLKAEAQGDELDNVLKMQMIIEKINEPLKREVARLSAELDDFKRLREIEVAGFKKEITEVKKLACLSLNCPNRR